MSPSTAVMLLAELGMPCALIKNRGSFRSVGRASITLCGAPTEEGEQPSGGTSAKRFEELSAGLSCRKLFTERIKPISDSS